jgi:O-succinylbenzoic acid--CoA ligase
LLSVVPTMLRALLEADRDGALRRVRAVLVGGAAAPRALLDACAERRVLALTTYGLTEACSQVTTQRLRAPEQTEAGSGHPLASVELRVARVNGAACARGEIGRILVRGPSLFTGYLRDASSALDPARDRDGFFDTGDLGALDADGALHVASRRADLVVTGGENVYPAEVEAALTALPGVGEALVFGAPDERWGQLVCAAVVAGEGFDEARFADAIATRLAPHKRPRKLAVVETLPTTAAGKPDRLGAAERLAGSLHPLTPRRA